MTPQQIDALKLALEALVKNMSCDDDCKCSGQQAITAIKEALKEHAMRETQRLGQEIEQDHAYGYASRLAVAIWQKHYMKDAPKWKPLDTTEGVLTQIDNMTCGLVREKPAQPEQEPVIGKWSLREVYFDEDGEPISHRSPPQRTEQPAQRTWVGLTEQDLDYLCNLAYTGDEEFALAVQAKLMEKNA